MDVKRIITSVGMLAFAGAVVVGGTGAFFSSQTASTGNVFKAGAVDLEIQSIEHDYTGGGVGLDVPSFATSSNETGFSFMLDDIKPLDEGTITYELENKDNQIHLCVMVKENMALSMTPNPPAQLANHLSFKFGASTGLLSSVAGQWYSLGQMDPGPVTIPYSVDYCFGTYDGGGNCILENINYNPLQNSALGVDVHFYAVQTRNNANFDCASLNEPV